MNLARNRRIVRGLVATTAILGLSMGLGACSQDDGASDAPDAAASSQPESAGDGAAGEEDPSDDPSSTQVEPSMGDDFTGVLADVTTEECPTEHGDVEATGTVINSKDKARDILVSVVWLKKNSGDSLAVNYVELKDVPAGESVEWSVPATLNKMAARCVVAAKSNKVGTLG